MSKNTRTRILLTAVAALLLVAMTVGGTLAWLADTTSEVTNTFKPSNIDIELWEHNLQDNGTLGTTEVTANNNYKMVPGQSVPKDPFVRVKANSEAIWIFVTITKSDNYSDYLKDYVVKSSEWTKLDSASSGNTEVWYKQQAAVTADTIIEILNPQTLTVKEGVTNVEMAALNANNYPTLKFQAYAIQQAGFETVEKAWTEVSTNKPAVYPAP